MQVQFFKKVETSVSTYNISNGKMNITVTGLSEYRVQSTEYRVQSTNFVSTPQGGFSVLILLNNLH